MSPHSDVDCSLSTTPNVGAPLLGYDCSSKHGLILEEKIGGGRFGTVYSGRSENICQPVAIKLERNDGSRSKLVYEAQVYKNLAKGGDGTFPMVHWCGVSGAFNIVVMDLLGPSLEDVFNACGRQMGQQQLSAVGLGILGCVEYLHIKRFVHRNIKPKNVVFCPQSLDKVYLIDLVLAKKYVEKKTRDHIKIAYNKPLLSDVNFTSTRSHFGAQQSRRDDIEAVGHILLYLWRGALPWQGQKSSNVKLHKVLSIDSTELHYPEHITTFLRYARDLLFDEEPNYRYLRSLLHGFGLSNAELASPKSEKPSAMPKYNFSCDWRLSWLPLKTDESVDSSERRRYSQGAKCCFGHLSPVMESE